MTTKHVNIQVCIQHVVELELDGYGKVKTPEAIREERINVVADTLDSAIAKATGMMKLL
jgi:hypothetical protein